MKKLVKRIQRQHHLQHLVNIAPFVTMIFVLQCYLISHLEMAQNHNDYYLFLGFSLALILGVFVIHDTYYHVDLYEDHLHLHFKILAIDKKIPLLEIQDVIVPNEAQTFSSVQLKLANGKNQNIYLIDDAQELKEYIVQFNQQKSEKKPDNFDIAA